MQPLYILLALLGGVALGISVLLFIQRRRPAEMIYIYPYEWTCPFIECRFTVKSRTNESLQAVMWRHIDDHSLTRVYDDKYEGDVVNEPKKFSRKPVEVEAVEYNGTRVNAYRLMAWVLESGGKISFKDGYSSQGPDILQLESIVGYVPVLPGEWVVRHEDGTFEVFVKDDFWNIFEPATS